MRAVVVLLLLIANAIVSTSRVEPTAPAPPVRTEYSLGLLSTVDGAAVPPARSDVVATPLCRRTTLELEPTRVTATERRSYNCTGENADVPLLDGRL